MEALACSLPPSQVVWSCRWQEIMAKAKAAMFFLNLCILFSTWVLPTCLCRSRWSRGSVPVDQHLPGREQGWQRCQWSAQLLLSKEHSLRYPKDLPLYLVSRLQYTHRQLKLHMVVEDRQPFYWYCSTQNYSVLTKTWFIRASDCNILGPALVWWIYCIVWQI